VQRVNRQFVRVVGPYGKAASLRVEPEHQLPRFQNGPVLVAEERHEQLVVQITSIRLPINVKPARVFGCRTPLQYVDPPRIIGTAHAHVVGDEIEHLTKTILTKRRNHVSERRLVAKFRIEPTMIYNVITMRAARPCLQVRRGVHVADSEPSQIRSEGRGILEAEPFMELQTVGRPGNRDGTGLRHLP